MPQMIEGRDARGKIILLKPDENEGLDKLLFLTERQRQILLQLSKYMEWDNRWKDLPDDLTDDETRRLWVSDTQDRLMKMVEFCAEVINCLENDEDTKNVINNIINITAGNSGTGPSGNNMPPSRLNQNLVDGSNPTCDLGVLFAQCRAVVTYTDLAVKDVFDKIEVATNAVEFAGAFWDSLPILGAVDDLLGANGVKELFNYYQEAITEQYLAEYTETDGGMRDELSYGLFCMCKVDCEITIERIFQFYKKRVSVYFSPPSFAGFINVLEFMFGLEQDTPFVVDSTHFIAWSLVKYGNLFFGKRFNGVLQLILKLKADEPSNDYIALGELFGDCPEYVCVDSMAEPLITPFNTDFFVTSGDTVSINPFGVWNGGAGADVDARGNGSIANELFLVPGAQVYRMVFRIGTEGDWFAIDDDFIIDATESGDLYAAMNDIPGGYSDNSGCISIAPELLA